MVVEDHLSVDNLVLEVNVGGPQRRIVYDLREGQIVRRDETDGPTLHQRPNDGFRANAAVMGVGAVQDLVQEKEDRTWPRCPLHDLPQAHDLRVEPRLPFLE